MSVNSECAAQLKKLRAEAEESMNSIDRLTYEVEKSWWNLVARVGIHRAMEIVTQFIEEYKEKRAA